MAKKKPVKKKPAKRTDGPYLAAAFFCESIIEDKRDGALTAVRMVDTISLQLPHDTPEDFPSETTRLPVPVAGVLSFKSGGSPGDHMIRLIAQSPSGKSETVLEQNVALDSQPQGGVNIRLNQVIQVKQGGLFWLHVFLDEEQVTSMPLMITVLRLDSPSNQPPSDHDTQ
jgi:hypothetical protein